MDWEATDPSQALKLFKQKCELYFSVKDIKTEKQVQHILLFAGETGLRFFNSWGLPLADAVRPDKVWEKFQTQVEPKTNFRVARLFLQQIRQEDGETFDAFISRCKLQAQKCNFRDTQEYDERVIEQAITGTCHAEVQKELLSKDNTLDLEKVLDVGRTHEASKRHMEQFKSAQATAETNQMVHYMRKGHKGEKMCTRCGYQAHQRKQDCPALGTTCSVCGKQNHWSTVCRTKDPNYKRRPKGDQGHRVRTQQRQHQQQSRQSRSVHEMTQEDDEFSPLTINSLRIGAISSETEDTRTEAITYLQTKLEKQKMLVNLRVKVDTGAQGNTLSLRMFKQMFPKSLTPEGLPKANSISHSNMVLTAYNGTTIRQYGCVELPCRFGSGSWARAKFYVVDSTGPAIIGLPSSRQLNMVTLHCAIAAADSKPKTVKDLVELYPDQFDKIGKFPGKYHIELKEDATPVVHAQRKFSIHLRDQLKAQLDNMENNEVIKKVQEPTDWVNSMVCTKKSDGSLRVCLDPKDLNKAIKRCHYKTPTLE